MRRIFWNLETNTATLPGILMVSRPDGLYYGRVVHAEVDHYRPPTRQRLPPQRHMHYHIILVTDGEGTFQIDDRLLPARPGMVFFSSPGQSHQFLNAEKDTTRYAELTFEFRRDDGKSLEMDFSDLLSAWTRQQCDPVNFHPLAAAHAHNLSSAITALVDRGMAPPRPDNLELGGLMAEVFIMNFRYIFQQATTQPDQIDRARDIIRSRYREKLHVPALAREVGVSPAHFSRQYKKRFGRAPIDYQLELRLRSACEMLRTSTEPLAAIAAATGFDDVYYFSRLFRKRLGQAPGQFRQAAQITSDGGLPALGSQSHTKRVGRKKIELVI